jgi:hypothetical protein
VSASQYCKDNGVKSLSHVCRVSGVPIATANVWYKTKPKLFQVLVAGVAQIDNGHIHKQTDWPALCTAAGVQSFAQEIIKYAR